MFVCFMLLEEETDQERFERLYRAYAGVMYHAAYDVLGNADDAEDAVQQAFVKILEHLYQVRQPVCPVTRAYVLIITRRTAIDLYRRRRRQATVPLDEATVPSNGSEIEQMEDASPIAAAIAQLPDRYRDVILLKYDMQLSNREIAELLSLSEAAVRKRIQRGKKLLQKNLEEQGVVL